MKKIVVTLMAVALAGMVFSAGEDQPDYAGIIKMRSLESRKNAVQYRIDSISKERILTDNPLEIERIKFSNDSALMAAKSELVTVMLEIDELNNNK